MALGTPTLQPLSETEYDQLATWLDSSSPFDLDGVFGLLHAIAVAPNLIPPSAWLELVLPSGPRALSGEQFEMFVGLLFRLYADIQDAINHQQAIFPDPDDTAECESFAAGYAAGAALDVDWTGDADRWSFAEPMAYLGGRLDLVSDKTIEDIEKNLTPDPKAIMRRDLGALLRATEESFRKLRAQGSQTESLPVQSEAITKVGRNDICPCGSGKKYKRCCINAPSGATAERAQVRFES